jgi:competence protein ComEC
MLIASVLSFCAGIYYQAISPLFSGLLLGIALPLITISAVLSFKWPKLAAVALIPTFFFVGAMRLSLIDTAPTFIDQILMDKEGPKIFHGTVIESSAAVKTVALKEPRKLSHMRVVYLSAENLDVSQEIRVFGTLKPLIPTFNNPGTRSWKWVKKWEGANFELKGTLLSSTRGDNWVAGIRRYFKENIDLSDAKHKDILKALTVGDRTSVPQEKSDLFMRTGTSHILAISGFNVGIISGFFFILVRTIIRRIHHFRLSGKDTRYAALASIPFPFLFMLVAGSGVSVIRATIMTIVFMIALFLEREKHFYNTTALAGLLILVIYPHSLLTPSFQLTFVSLLAIVMFMEGLLPLVIRIKNKIALWGISTLLSTIGATLGTAPIVIYYFYGINPFCFIHNLVTIPLLGVGATTMALLGMTFPCAHHLLLAAGFITDVNVRLLQALDFGYIFPIIRPTLIEIILYFCLITTALFSRRKPVAAILCVIVIPLCVLQLFFDYRERFNDDFRIHFIDVGMGDAALIEAPGGVRALIDGGGFPGSDFDTGKNVITPFLLYRKILHLDYIINTHPHIDHIGGLPYVLSHFSVSHLVTPGLYPRDTNFQKLVDVAKTKKVEHLLWKKDDGFDKDSFSLRVFHPQQINPLNENLNNDSLVLKLTFKNNSFLLPGDILTDIEEKLILSRNDLKSDVLKLAHHGSSLSNSAAFLFAVKPHVVVLSGGRTHKSLPGDRAMERVNNLNIPILRTDRQGLIEMWTHHGMIHWKTQGK